MIEARLEVGRPLAELVSVFDHRQPFVITDEIVARLLPPQLAALPRFEIGQGEKCKTLATVQQIYDALLAAQCDRSGLIVGIGGGLVCDVAAFAASTWLRGIGLILAPTTLLAQVDAAIGGKTAVNHAGFKNLIGSFYPAEYIWADPAMLQTLPPALLADGYAELIKHAIIADSELFDQAQPELLQHPTQLGAVLNRAMSIKAEIVRKDPTERAERMLLNFGHTLGHAIESVSGLSHGSAVAVGMVAAARLSHRRGMLAASECDRIEATLAQAGLPTTVPLHDDQFLAAMSSDKKRRHQLVNLVLLEKIGKAVIVPTALNDLPGLIDVLH